MNGNTKKIARNTPVRLQVFMFKWGGKIGASIKGKRMKRIMDDV